MSEKFLHIIFRGQYFFVLETVKQHYELLLHVIVKRISIQNKNNVFKIFFYSE